MSVAGSPFDHCNLGAGAFAHLPQLETAEDKGYPHNHGPDADVPHLLPIVVHTSNVDNHRNKTPSDCNHARSPT